MGQQLKEVSESTVCGPPDAVTGKRRQEENAISHEIHYGVKTGERRVLQRGLAPIRTNPFGGLPSKVSRRLIKQLDITTIHASLSIVELAVVDVHKGDTCHVLPHKAGN